MHIFKINGLFSLYIPGYCSRFNQSCIKSSILDTILGIHGCRGLTVCIVFAILNKQLEHLCSLVSMGKGCWNQPISYGNEGMTVIKVLKSQNLHVDFWLHEVNSFKLHVVQGSTILLYFLMFSIWSFQCWCSSEFHQTVVVSSEGVL